MCQNRYKLALEEVRVYVDLAQPLPLSIIPPFRPRSDAVLAEELFQVVGHFRVSEAVGLAHRRELPPVLRVGVHLGRLQQELDALLERNSIRY